MRVVELSCYLANVCKDNIALHGDDYDNIVMLL